MYESRVILKDETILANISIR